MIPPTDIFTAVLAHGGARETFRRHLPLWRATSDRICAITPTDDTLAMDDVVETSYGLSEHHGPHHIHRVRLALETMATSSCPIFVLHEYDSLLLDTPDGIRPPAGGIAGNVKTNNRPDKYQGHYYINFPWILDRSGVTALTRGLDNSPPGTEHDRRDRLLAVCLRTRRNPGKGLAFAEIGIFADHPPCRRSQGAAPQSSHDDCGVAWSEDAGGAARDSAAICATAGDQGNVTPT